MIEQVEDFYNVSWSWRAKRRVYYTRSATYLDSRRDCGGGLEMLSRVIEVGSLKLRPFITSGRKAVFLFIEIAIWSVVSLLKQTVLMLPFFFMMTHCFVLWSCMDLSLYTPPTSAYFKKNFQYHIWYDKLWPHPAQIF